MACQRTENAEKENESVEKDRKSLGARGFL
jgi:hypothetical protein